MSGKEQFDRSKCFTFFESYYTTGQMIEVLIEILKLYQIISSR